ncbi:zinc finger and BTB domain-containing protein 20-like isoform X2 [Bolinopsis microptera]|uniref:zinc finger and BTB domain-containing protein 20-like isoform X2 n=1 Tax=Bolinopsis microptera TaxID=2820187 RepID=UPI0030793EF2
MPIFKKILKSQRGGKILIDQDGYLYNYLRETGKGSTWACRAKYKLNCYTRVYYCEGSTSDHVEITVDHNHPPKLGEARTIELMRKLKTGAKNSYKIRRELIKELNSPEYTMDLDQDLPTLLKNRKSESRSRSVSSTSLQPEVETQDIILDVDNNAPDISSILSEECEEEDSRTELSSETSRINEELQDVLQKLINEPDLLQDLVNSLMGPSGEGEIKAESMKEKDSQPQTSYTQPQTSANLPFTSELDSLPPNTTVVSDLPPLVSNTPLTSSQCSSNLLQPLLTSPQSGMIITSSPSLMMTSSGPMMTSSSPQIMAMPVPMVSNSGGVMAPGQIVATVGHGSDNTLVAGQLVRLPESIISNDMLFKRMNEGGCTLYIAPPALKNPYCRQCNSSFNSAQQMDQHFQSLKCCEMCKMAFCVQAHYDKHVELNHPDGNKSAWGTLCETCGRVFGVQFQLDSHRIKCSNRVSLRCPRCFYSFGFEGDITRHKALHGSMLGVRCEACQKSFPTSLGLQNHQSRRNTANSKDFVAPRTCTLCFKKFCLEADYLKHINTHNQEILEANAKLNGASASQADKVCHFCTKTFSTQRKLLTHQAQHMDLNICKFCGVWCQNQSELVDHERVNHVFKAS